MNPSARNEAPVNRGSVLITGASSGLGLEIALILAASGYRVYATMRNLQVRSALEVEAQRRRLSIRVLQLDLHNVASINAAVEQILTESGELFAVVNNAGMIRWGYFEDLSDAELRELYDTNVFGTMAVTRACLPAMRRLGRGRIIIISSTAGRLAVPGNSAYCSSKFALEGFGEALARELRHFNIQVSLIEPSLVATELFRGNRRVARGALASTSAYGSYFENLVHLTNEWLGRTPLTTVDVADVVRTVLEVRRARLRYVVGCQAQFLLGVRNYAPELFDRLWSRAVNGRLSCRPTGGLAS